MSQTPSTRRGGPGRLLLWLALLLSVALLGFVVAVASRANPLQSDRETNGISKYRFLQECRELAGDAEKLSVSAMGQTISLKALVEQGRPLGAGDQLHAELDAGSGALVRAVQPVPTGGWTLSTPATIGVSRAGTLQTLGQLPLSCAYSKKEGKVVAQVQLPNQPSQ